jgi:hypothetical protein
MALAGKVTLLCMLRSDSGLPPAKEFQVASPAWLAVQLGPW